MSVTYPNESKAYRAARDELMQAELELRAHVERVAAQRRNLPPGGPLKEDYIFEKLVDGQAAPVRLSELFEPGKDTLFIYSLMYAPDMANACPMCTALLDGLQGQVAHLSRQINVAVVAKQSLDKIHEHAASRGWSDFRLLSSAHNSYNIDYFGEVDGHQISNANVFIRDGVEIRHFWGAEMTRGPEIEGGNMRHLDMIWPLWNVLDMTPGGRGSDWYPSLSYQ